MYYTVTKKDETESNWKILSLILENITENIFNPFVKFNTSRSDKTIFVIFTYFTLPGSFTYNPNKLSNLTHVQKRIFPVSK